jgi:hypothetical protein
MPLNRILIGSNQLHCYINITKNTKIRALMMEAENTSETSVDNYLTRQYIREDISELHTRRCENLKSRICNCFYIAPFQQVNIRLELIKS